MPKKENVEFLVGLLRPLPKFPTSIYETMLTWLFGTEERTIEACAFTAYTDLRKSPLGGIGKMPEDEKKAWKDAISVVTAQCVTELFSQGASDQEAFDTWHKATCEKICEESNKRDVPKYVSHMTDGFSYGVAQKWLNMTIKNAIVMERWDKEFAPIKMYLHIPVDSFIMEAASKLLEIDLPRKSGTTELKAWSRWAYDDYIAFQTQLRKAVDCPLDWEFIAWNEVKESQKAK